MPLYENDMIWKHPERGTVRDCDLLSITKQFLNASVYTEAFSQGELIQMGEMRTLFGLSKGFSRWKMVYSMLYSVVVCSVR